MLNQSLDEYVVGKVLGAVCFQESGPRMKVSRWMSVVDCVQYRDQFTHSKLLHTFALGRKKGEHTPATAL